MSGLLDSKRWDVLPRHGESERVLCEELGIPPLVARVLCARGVCDPEEARRYLAPSLVRDWVDPYEIPGMRAVADRVERAIEDGECIAVFGDFDVDGMTSTCLLTLALRELGAHAHPFIPHRFGEGYGLSREALNRVISDCNPQLIVTVDNGIAAANEVAWLLEQGIDVVITDHHEPGDLVPQGVPVTDPKMSEDCASRELAGVGVALKLVCVLGSRLGKPDLWQSYVDLAAMGTISDMMLLQGENRSLVAEGIARMRYSTRPGIVALAATAKCDLTQVTSDNLPFSLIPRLNAAGRMGSTDTAFDLLISDDPAQAAVLAASLERINTERRETEARLSDEAIALLKKSYDGERVIVLAGEGWHEGVKGIVASRIVSIYHVPTIIFTVSDGIARGSGRSVGSVDLFHAVEQCSDVLVRFGGHAGAVGVTCEASRVDEFRRRMQQVMTELPDEQFEDRGEVTAVASLGELGLSDIQQLESLQPFGQGNKRPLIGVRGVFMRNRARVGYDANHLRFVATDGVNSIPAIMFRTPHMNKAYACEGLVDLVADAVSETWQGRTQAKLMVRDILYRDDAALEDVASGERSGRSFTSSAGVDGSLACRADSVVPRARCAQMPLAQLTDHLRTQLIGSSSLLPAQDEALSRLAEGRSTFCVMATGRGKSLIFHLHAARLALANGLASVFVFPLRALVSDQAFHLTADLAELGVSVRVMTGESSTEERTEVFDGLKSGAVDVVLTTPEFLAIHTERFAESGRVGFLVVDEAHHAGVAKSGNREAYEELDRILRDLGNPVALAVTATASTPIAREVCRLLSIRDEDVIVDRTVRPNLAIDDHRDLRERDLYLASIVAAGEKCVVYVNSRDQSVMLTRTLRARIPEIGERISFYHAGLSRGHRTRIERAFRDGRLSCIIATSAFGEGVNLPGIRDVVLYHMPFGATEFNQMSGRAGRDGRPAQIHLLFGSRDARINESLLSSSAPTRSDLVTLYRILRKEAGMAGGQPLSIEDDILAQMVFAQDRNARLDGAAVAAGIAVFDELGFLDIEGFGESRRIRLNASPAHADLQSSIRYSEGLRSVREFTRFRDWVLSATAQEMLCRINRPIVPGFGKTVDG
ncbi:MAG: single-stranded-DNA-specific exonuclease RecJ [Atopobiaceae bacterium]|nr:single-stranded-DNA-specific exonuclease RecJ [Atopobiaceae bacterium]